eukprot:CAMPEP_0197524290 /NCGR_PEP_ID=MMETSP1318-20131121/9001_1 /TAXON_ID=552666 /ORGANISM="Partenskyella glossopodia, Strain RCC365" /LENGTH=343 /DNA_ID=CAMNT_0043077215 /DNA_START=188 /DNA_END=1219 /DNA_ORIENTATION=+
MASLVRKYKLFYHLGNGMIEMYDPKNRRTFLKKCKYDSIELKDLYLGAKISVYSRLLTVVSYGDDFTRRSLQLANSKTLCIVKAPAYDFTGRLLDCFIQNGFEVTNAKLCQLSVKQASELVTEAEEDVKSLALDNVFAFELKCKDAVSKLNDICASPMVRKIVSKIPLEAALYTSKSATDVKRQLDLMFGYTVVPSATFNNCTMCCIKPQAIKDGHAGKILDAILNDGYEISGLEMFRLDVDAAKEFLEVYDTVVPYYSGMVKHLTEGPIIAMEIRTEKEKTVPLFREFAGPADPVVARHIRPHTLRAKFGKNKIENGIHCTDLPEDGVLESEFFFSILQKAK